MAPRIGFVSIDVQGYWPGGRYYVQNIIRSLALLPRDERPSMRDVWWLKRDPGDLSFDAVRELLEPCAIIAPPMNVVERFRRKIERCATKSHGFGDLFRAAGVDALFPTSECEDPGVPLIFWLPDFQYRRRPDLHSPELRAWFEENYERKIKGAELVVVSSEDVMRDFQRYMPQFADRARLLKVASLPQREWFELDAADVAQVKGVREKYFLICNQFTAHKNHLNVFEAVRLLKTRGIDIEIACTGHAADYKGEKFVARLEDFIAEHDLGSNVKMLGFLPRNEQIALFRGAIAIVQPSSFEGWSTPAEDAMTLGRPIIMSDIAVHREKLDALNAPELVGADDVEGWASALHSAWRNPVSVSTEMERAALTAAHVRAFICARSFIGIAQEAVARNKEHRAA